MGNDKYTIKRQVIWYDPITKNVSPTRKDGYMRFDSRAEFSLYQLLLKYVPMEDIEVHSDIGVPNLKWKVDFKLSPRISTILKLSPFVATIPSGTYKHVYIEYKGVLNKETKAKLQEYTTLHERPCLIVVSNRASLVELHRVQQVQPVISLQFLETILSVLKYYHY